MKRHLSAKHSISDQPIKRPHEDDVDDAEQEFTIPSRKSITARLESKHDDLKQKGLSLLGSDSGVGVALTTDGVRPMDVHRHRRIHWCYTPPSQLRLAGDIACPGNGHYGRATHWE